MWFARSTQSGDIATHADFQKASELIATTDWDALLCEDVDESIIQWFSWHYGTMYPKSFSCQLSAIISHGSLRTFHHQLESKVIFSREPSVLWRSNQIYKYKNRVTSML